MALNQRLDIRGQQTQTITPQLQQAIEMLQLTNLELAALVERELEQNPLLERAEAGDDITPNDNLDALQDNPQQGSFADDDAPPQPNSGSDDFASADTLPDSLDAAQSDRAVAGDAPLDTTYDNHWDEGADAGFGNLADWQARGAGDPYASAGDSAIDNAAAHNASLREHVLAQIAVDVADPADRIIASYLVDGLDDAGYWRGDVHDVATALECAPERVTLSLLRLQQLDPAGIFARNLAECLMLQLRERNRLDPWMQKLLQHLDLLGAHKMPELLKLIGCGNDELRDMIAEIRTLNPKPGESFASNRAETLLPDIFLRVQKGGGWHVELNHETLPRVLVNNRYYAQVKTQAQTGEAKKYLSEKFQAANFLIKAMHQRAQTMIKVASAIVQHQEGFFNYGVEYLRPLVRRDIATAIGMHESTISRVTMGKYMATPRGIFELRYFFSASVPSADGRIAHAAESVRHRIKALIDKEPPGQPLSDDKLVALLRADGVDVARRTVAKYREQLHIPTSAERRRLAQSKS